MVQLKKLAHLRGYDVYSVVSLALVLVSVTLGAPIIGHLQSFWTFCGDSSQNAWNAFIDRVGEDPSTLWFWATLLLQIATYWLFGGLFTVADFTLSQSALRQYKTQPEAKESLAPRRLLKVVLVVLFNQIVVGTLIGYVVYMVMDWRGFPPIRELPSLVSVATSLALFGVTAEVAVYYTHRLHHARFIYRYVHKIHHEWKAPIAITAQYMHPVEAFTLGLTAIIGAAVAPPHPVILWLMVFLSTIGAVRDHSGYLQPTFGTPSHDYHHIRPTECYGAFFAVMDQLHGTNKTFLSSGHGVRRDDPTRAGMKEETQPQSLTSNTTKE